MNQIKIIQQKQPERQDSIFYTDTIAEMLADNDVLFTVVSTGDVDFELNGTNYRRHDGAWNDTPDGITDKDLEEVEFVNNSWFQIEAFKDGEYFETNDECVYDYDDAIELLKSTVSDYNDTICKNCHGKGSYMGDDAYNTWRDIECEACSGTGKIE